jgi:GNAT superfamily N-acetyltransferase
VIEVRPCADEAEEERALAVYNTVRPWDAITIDEVRSFRAIARAYAAFLARHDGLDAGSVASAVLPTRPHSGWTVLSVLPEHRRRGVGTALYRTVSDWLRGQGIEEIRASVNEDDPDALTFAERRGFREVERNARAILDLGELDAPAIDPPAGIEITTWAERPELTAAIFEVEREAQPDIPGCESREPDRYEDWLAHMQRPDNPRDATFLALADGEVVGYAKLSLTAAQPRVGFHDMTAVKRARRGRGIAGALKRAQIGWAKAHGFERLHTENELRNEPIRRLNNRLGYRPAPGYLVLNGPLAS